MGLLRVTHPGGRTFDRFPVKANEAEARRASRFSAGGHTPGLVDLSAILDASPAAAGVGAQSLEYPRTLDLQRAPDFRGHPGPRAS
jgi:uncharacterized protein (DUF2126 family)